MEGGYCDALLHDNLHVEYLPVEGRRLVDFECGESWLDLIGKVCRGKGSIDEAEALNLSRTLRGLGKKAIDNNGHHRSRLRCPSQCTNFRSLPGVDGPLSYK